MDHTTYLALGHNIALLLGAALIFDVLGANWHQGRSLARQVVAGLALSAIGMMIMSTPWTLQPGLIFDTRSVLISLSGLYFGGLSTIITLVATSAYRLHVGGIGAYTGVLVIIASGGIGIAWRCFRRGSLGRLSWGELYVLGLVVHVAMLAMMLTLPWEAARQTLSTISLPVLIIFPLGTMLTGKLLDNRLRKTQSVIITRESERAYRRLAEYSADAIYLADKNGNIIDTNQAGCASTGYDKSELLQMKIWDLDTSTTPERFYRFWKDYEENEPVLLGAEHERKDGTKFPVEIKTLQYMEDGERYYYGIARDVSDRKRHEYEASIILETSFDGVLVMGSDKKISHSNPTASEMLGYTPSELEMMYVWQIDVHFDKQRIDEIVYSLKREGGSRFETKYQRKDGRIIDVEVSASHIDSDGEKIVSFFRDVTERKEIERQLLLTKESIDKAALSIFWIKPDGSVVYVNDIACSLLDYSRDEFMQLSIWDIAPRFPGKVESNAESKSIPPDILQFDIDIIPRKGYPIPVQITSSHIEYSGQEYILVYAQDISELKQAESKIYRATKRQEEILSAVPAVVYVCDVDSKFSATFVSENIREVTGHTPEDFISIPGFWIGCLHPDDKDRVMSEMDQLLKTGVLQHEYRFRCADGSYIWVYNSVRLKRDANGNPLECLGSMLDITGSKKSEEQLKAEMLRRSVLMEQSKDGILFINQEHRVIESNKRFAELLGYTQEEVLELYTWEYEATLTEEDVRRDFANLSEISMVFETMHRRKDGSLIDVEVSVSGTKLLGERIVMAIVRDISERKQLEARLIQAKDQAESSNRAKSMFLANMSHELRTPLNGIMGVHQLLITTNLSQEQQHYVNMAIQSAKRLTSLLGDILDLSRVEAGRMEILSRPFRPAELFDTVDQLFSPMCRQKGVDLRFHPDPKVPAVLAGDPSRMQQILNNIVGNAVKFTESGSIDVSTYALPAPDKGTARVLFSISDTGPGIEDESLETLFDSFTQADDSFTRRYQGAGLGLAIVKQLVTLMGGNMAVESEPGKGTTFHIGMTFSVVEEDALDRGTASQPIMHPGREGLRVLVVDDDMISQFSIEVILKKWGHSVATAINGKSALEMLEKGVYDVVLMDIQMPVMDGVAATKVIRGGEVGEGNRNIPIIALTAYAMSGDRERFLDAGMDGYLSKPVLVDDLKMCLSGMWRPEEGRSS
ncbi:PAS domain S-box protein [Oceanidesulfovibrio marinus]|uniref:Sensory/regulatory protein RpfC n=1 Tax=Oceanidesulfovibrio marinus TaxID=370038 RepID=A0A6P1ZEZ5_9BACT|nr:PAS domain S-box protein [Oceanidesulfovibrio marinus]TVM32258.1 hypothetical protein DQK91_15355 [Oceanidesulfovibrio marinus]